MFCDDAQMDVFQFNYIFLFVSFVILDFICFRNTYIHNTYC